MKLDYSWEGPDDFRAWGPYISYGKDASTQVYISWQSKFFSMFRWIEYGETPECEKKILEEIEPNTMHYFYLDNLKPGQTYYFKISRPEDLQKKEPPIYSFRTAPEKGSDEPIDCVVVGDMHCEGNNCARAYASMMKNAPDMKFLVGAGDCVTHGGVEKAWNNYFYQLHPYTAKFPIMMATGNHDTDHPESYAHFIQTFHNPYADPSIGGYYNFIYGNVLFIMLDSDNAGQTVATQGVISDEQYEWLEEVLELYAKKDYWIFIVMHHPMYSTGDTGMMNIYHLAYRDLFDEYHVDAVFYGHDHHFEYYWASRDEDWGGTQYILVGNGGGSLDTFIMDPKREPHPPNYLWKGRTYIYERDGILDGFKEGVRNDEIIKEAHVYGIIEHGFVSLHIEGDVCDLKVWGWENQLLFHDRFKRTGTGKRYHKPLYMREF